MARAQNRRRLQLEDIAVELESQEHKTLKTAQRLYIEKRLDADTGLYVRVIATIDAQGAVK